MVSVPLLRPNQIREYDEVRQSLEATLANPHSQDKRTIKRQLKRAERDYESQVPKAFEGKEVDGVVKRTEELLDEIKVGMPSQEEMRKCPPGAINKHRSWELRNKGKIEEWKQNKLRLNVGTDDPDVANLEIHRPERSSLSMDNAFIPGTNYLLGTADGVAVVFTSEDLTLIKERAPDIYPKVALMDAGQRAIIKMQYVTDYEEPEAAKELEAPSDSIFGNEDKTATSGVGKRRDRK